MDGCITAINSTSTDVVIYNPAKIPITVTLTLPKRDFFFFHRKITIKQKWEPGGKGGTEIGFGASVYDSSIVMAEFLQEPVLVGVESHVAGKSVVELGCGP
eukprot:gene34099-44057_t